MLFSSKEPPPPAMAVKQCEQHLKQTEGNLSYRLALPAEFAGPRDICKPHVGFGQAPSPLSASSVALAGNG